MATITGGAGTQSVSVVTSSAVQTAFAQQILGLASSLNTPLQIIPPASGNVAVTSSAVVDTGTAPHLLLGSASVPEVRVLLGGQNASFATGGTKASTVVAGDNSNSAIVNNNPGGALVAITGAGNNALGGFTGANQFVTAAGGQDVVFMYGASNNLLSNGNEAVLVGGPSTIVAAPGSADNVQVLSGASLAFVNNSDRTSSISGSNGATVVVSGTGQTSVTAGGGTESFSVDTAAGNVTLTGSSSGADTFTFFKDAGNATGTARDVVTNFTAADTVQVRGYAGFSVQADPANGAGSILTLSDGATIRFTDANAATVQAHLKSV